MGDWTAIRDDPKNFHPLTCNDFFDVYRLVDYIDALMFYRTERAMVTGRNDSMHLEDLPASCKQFQNVRMLICDCQGKA